MAGGISEAACDTLREKTKAIATGGRASLEASGW